MEERPVEDLPTEELDVRGLKCPLPAMLARKALARLQPQTWLTVLADDPMALVDMPYMCHREGHTLEEVREHPAHAVFRIRAKTGPAITPGEEEAPGAEPKAQGDPARSDSCLGRPLRDQGAG